LSLAKKQIKKYYKRLTTFITILFACSYANAQLAEGDVMFVGFNADSLDGFAVVALKTIPANSVIHFNDNEWNGLSIGSGGAFNNASETELSWYTGIAAILPGTVVTFNQTNNSGTISVTTGTVNGTISLAAGNEVLYAFLGTDSMTPTTFYQPLAMTDLEQVQ